MRAACWLRSAESVGEQDLFARVLRRCRDRSGRHSRTFDICQSILAAGETVGGSTATPGRYDWDEIGEAMGVAYVDGEELKDGEKEEGRDKHRWEFDPASSEACVDRTSGSE